LCKNPPNFNFKWRNRILQFALNEVPLKTLVSNHARVFRSLFVTIGDAFDESVAYYDEWVKIALPDYQAIFSVAKDLIPYGMDESIDVLDLGAGTGLFSQHVLEECPRAKFTLIDVAEEMLAVARERFKANFEQFQFVVGDYREIDFTAEFDLVVSSLSIHHLIHGEKQKLFRKIHAALREGGLFLNIDQVKGPTPDLREFYWSHWLAAVRERGANEKRIHASIARRKAYDHDALLTDQLVWLNDAGFVDVDCVYKNTFVGVFVAVKSGIEARTISRLE
jgi:tRNA (cmo5U34)-methyltransferase